MVSKTFCMDNVLLNNDLTFAVQNGIKTITKSNLNNQIALIIVFNNFC